MRGWIVLTPANVVPWSDAFLPAGQSAKFIALTSQWKAFKTRALVVAKSPPSNFQKLHQPSLLARWLTARLGVLHAAKTMLYLDSKR